ncbi:MAG TPA: PAAR domain-containing protein [Pyrinomonadaceae bacterium]
MGNMAARLGDMTSHGSPLFPGPGSLTVLIGFQPAWRTLIDTHACPVVKGGVADVGGVVVLGSQTVFIDFQMACRVGDQVMEIPGGPNPIVIGCPTVIIG